MKTHELTLTDKELDLLNAMFQHCIRKQSSFIMHPIGREALDMMEDLYLKTRHLK